MSARRAGYPSVLKSGLVHFAISTASFAVVGGLGAAAIQLAGNPADAGPTYAMALFDTEQTSPPPALKSRLNDRDLAPVRMASLQPVPETSSTTEPSLGVPAPDETFEAQGDEAGIVIPAAAPQPARQGVRINGRTVYPGEAYSEVDDLGALPESPIAGLHARQNGRTLPVISETGEEIADAYARPYYGRASQPTVSLVVGGLGINYTHTKAAIDELPPEVTLSFAPHARGLQTWITRAREAGHEVLIELPLEAHNYGRVRPHSNTLRAQSNPVTNTSNLEQVLSLAHGYYGVINYQGDKFAANAEASQSMFEALRSRGVAFVEDGSLPPTSTLRISAGAAGARFMKADFVIDARMEADAMQSQLTALETAALEQGGALGTAISYPLTVDIIRDWTQTLDAKGMVLAPASVLQHVPEVALPATDADVPGDLEAAPSLP